LPRRLVQQSLAFLIAAALTAAVGGCSGSATDVFEGKDQAFTKPIFEVPDWAKASRAKTPSLGPSGPVGPEDLVDAAGHCAPEAARAEVPAAPAPAPAAPAAAPAQEPAAPAKPPSYGSVAGDLASARMPQGPPPAPTPVAATPSDRLDRLQPEGGFAGPQARGGIALGMTECQAVRRAGPPSNVSVSAGDKGARKVVLTYLSGSWPGIYTFDSGRLQEIDAAPDQPKPAKPVKKAPKKKAPPKTANTERMYVQ